MGDSGSNAERAAVEAFLDEFLADLGRGTPKSLEAYVARAPIHADAIRAEYEPLMASASQFRDPALDASGSVVPHNFHERFEGTAEAARATGGATAADAARATGGATAPESGTMAGSGNHFSAGASRRGGALPQPQQTIAHYRIEDEIGRGGMGVVYRAVDTHLGRTVALKVLAVPLRHDTYEVLLRFRREAEAASRLDHPGICPVFEAGTDDGLSWIAMRWVDGVPLARVLAQARAASGHSRAGQVDLDSATTVHADGQPTEAPRREAALRKGILSAMRLMEKTAAALHAAHEAGVVHRDVKPANIMVTRGNEPMLLDFGVARLEGVDNLALTQQGDRVGTPAYMSPEQLSGDPSTVDRRSDVWGLGVTLYELITLQQPFIGATRDQLARAILEHEPQDPRKLNRHVPRDLSLVVLTALQKDRQRRYRTAQELADDLRRIREHEPIHARPVPLPVRCLRWAQRNPAAAIGIGAVIIFLCAALVTTSFFLGNEREHAQVLQGTVTRLEELADTKRVRDLRQQAQAGWAADPVNLGGVLGMTAWLAQTDALLLRRGTHEAALLELQAAGAASAGAVAAWRTEAVQGLLLDLTALQITRARVAALALFTAAIEENSLRAPAALWAQARERMQRNPRYSGVPPLEAQLGLVPLGADPRTTLEEFAHLQSGSVPQRSAAANGELVLSEDSALVLVLLGNSDFVMGAEVIEREEAVAGANIDAMAQRSEGPAQRVALSAHFIGKHEITQAQWLRAASTNPSMHHPGVADRSRYHPTLLHPVESITHAEAARGLALWSLALPTEAQWENAARGRSDSSAAAPWWCGERGALAAAANLADQSLKEYGGPPMEYEIWHDGYVVHAPIGLRVPNGFGLHDMLGNVWEWCADRMAAYTHAVEPGTGLRMVAANAAVEEGSVYPGWVCRGGGFMSTAERARCTARDYRADDQRDKLVGLRAARALTSH